MPPGGNAHGQRLEGRAGGRHRRSLRRLHDRRRRRALYYRGYEIGDLAGPVPFEDVTRLLWDGELPTADESRAFRARLAEARALPGPLVALLRGLPRTCHPLDALRTALSAAAALDPVAASNEPEANLAKAFRLMTLIPAVVAAWHHLRQGQEPATAPAGGSHAAWFLTLLEGRAPAAAWRACSTSS